MTGAVTTAARTAPWSCNAQCAAAAAHVEQALDAALTELRGRLGEGPFAEALWTELAEACHGGKRVRPLLFLLAYNGYGGATSRDVGPGAAAIEILQTFALIHDDIVDRSLERRGRPSTLVRMQPYVAGVADREAVDAAHVAMLAGDVLFAFALDVFLAMPGDPAAVRDAARIVTGSSVRTAAGAATELVCRAAGAPLSEAALLELYDAKTGVYSFVCPLQAGARLAGAAEECQAGLHAFGLDLGRAYQMADDLQDLETLLSPHDGGPFDAGEGVLWFPVQAALRRLPPPAQDALQTALHRVATDRVAREQVRGLLQETDALAETRRCIHRSRGRAVARLAALGVTDAAQEAIGAVCARCFADGAGASS